jgi:hypothetical protein
MSYPIAPDSTNDRNIKNMEHEENEIVSYSIKMPKSLRSFFEEIAKKEQRDLSFIIRRILIREKAEILEQRNGETK